MIEMALYKHLTSNEKLASCLTRYADKPAVFNQEVPADTDELWWKGAKYGRVVFAEDIQGDPERTMGGTLVVDIQCTKEDEYLPEDIEPLIRKLIHGYFFTNGLFTVAAQFKNSSYFTEPTDQVIGCTVAFDLLAFPMLTTSPLDVVERLNAWTSKMEDVYVINYNVLPSNPWKPKGREKAVYWRVSQDRPAGWIPDTFQTIWRTSVIKGHIFTEDMATSIALSRELITRLYAAKRLLKEGESPIMVNQKNTADDGADPLRTGQVTIEATYGVIVHFEPSETIASIEYSEEKQNG